MILDTKYSEIREIINKKLDEFFTIIEEINYDIDLEINKEENIYNRDIEMEGNTNNLITSENNIDVINKENKIYISTSQILTKILLGKYYFYLEVK